MNKVDRQIKEAYDIQYKHYCDMHHGYNRVDAEVKKLEQAIMLSKQPSLAAFEKAVRFKQEAIIQWRSTRFYYKSLKKKNYVQPH